MAKQRIPRQIHSWTAQKLEHLSAYLEAFARATKQAGERHYVDAMAGCGECVLKRSNRPVLGSAWRALNVKPSFTGIHLVELDEPSALYLKGQAKTHPSMHVYQGDCNVVIPRDVLPNVSRRAPTLAFLDSMGVEPSWALVEALSRHRSGVRGEKVELLILFAFDMFVNRWIGLEKLWPRLDVFFGDPAWRAVDEESRRAGELIAARRERFVNYYAGRLKTQLGYQWADAYGPLMNRGHALYHMIFATDHAVGRKIMSDVWSRPRPLPDDMFYERKYEIEPPGWSEKF